MRSTLGYLHYHPDEIEIETLLDDFREAMLLVDINVVVTNPITGEKPHEYKVTRQ